MRAIWIKLGLFLCVWYEVSVELGLSGATGLLATLLVCGAGVMLLRLPLQVLSLMSPRMIAWGAPLAIWMGLAWWLFPRAVASYPTLALSVAALLAITGAAARYVVARYPQAVQRHTPMFRGLVTPLASSLFGLAGQTETGLLGLVVVLVLAGMPLRLGWRFVGPVPPAKFDAQMGEERSFRGSGFSDEV